jgi:hypothetical protein
LYILYVLYQTYETYKTYHMYKKDCVIQRRLAAATQIVSVLRASQALLWGVRAATKRRFFAPLRYAQNDMSP